ncbi:hypothetical protein F2Q68_00045469 [Brassica cretica]|uniref:Uncharacterized protein n=1 Tax=Brassica cretica TaxID=69181 RepID=A0A8S9LQJ0_BRACR|nr:hypothetical protein F2Q68_00045469 [Brassica cretica]
MGVSIDTPFAPSIDYSSVLATLQEVQSIIQKCLAAHDKLEASLRDLSRTGGIQTCKASRKSTDSLLKDLSKELRPLLLFLQSSPSASQISPKVLTFSTPSTHLLGYEKKSSGPDIENRIASQQQKIIALRQEVLGVPLEFWEAPTFQSIWDAIGETKEIDLDYRRVQVVVDGFKELIFETTLDFTGREYYEGEEVSVSLRYEKLFGYCKTCLSLCHKMEKCPLTTTSSEKKEIRD